MKRAAQHEICNDYYVLLCARRYAATAKQLASAATDDERQQHHEKLRYLLESGLLEAQRERERRLRQHRDSRKDLQENDGSIISRAISSQEAEILRNASSIPPIASINEFSALIMDGLADIFEGWAQNDLRDRADVARLLGWADGLRGLASAVGVDYVPPKAASLRSSSE